MNKQQEQSKRHAISLLQTANDELDHATHALQHLVDSVSNMHDTDALAQYAQSCIAHTAEILAEVKNEIHALAYDDLPF